MFVGKKGLSDIVTNILIILLVLVAVGILWFFIRPVLEKGAGGVSGIEQCLVVDVKARGCANNDGLNPENLTVMVERGVGEGDLKKINFILIKANGDSVVLPVASTLAVYGSQTFTFVEGVGSPPTTYPLPPGITSVDEIAKVNVAAVVGEQERECKALNLPVTCT